MADNSVFDQMAHNLLADYLLLFYVDIETDEYMWFTRDSASESFVLMQGGTGFYAYVRDNIGATIAEEDRDQVISFLKPDSLKYAVSPGGVKDVNFRYIGRGKTQYFTMRVLRRSGKDSNKYIVAVENVDDEEHKLRVVQKLKDEREIYNQIAKSLAAEYETIYYIDIESGKYMEFSSHDFNEIMKVPKNWEDFYNDAKEDVRTYVHPDDRDFAVSMYDKETIKEQLSKKKSYNYKYRLMTSGEPRYYLFTVIRANEGKNFVLCIKDIEDDLKAERIRKERQQKAFSFTQIAESLASNYDVIYYVDIEDASYVGYTSKNIFGHMEVQEQGPDFYHDIGENIPKIIHPDDRERLLGMLTKDNLLSTIDLRRSLEADYRMIIKEAPQFTRLTARKSSDGKHFIIGIENIDELVKKENDQLSALNAEKEIARRDGLTGVKNKFAYDELIKSVQTNINNGVDYLPFAIAVCDLNYLKQTNDTLGHQAGDELLKSACKLICDTFDHSPVFRIGGDEFTVFIRGDDYVNRAQLESAFKEKVLKNNESGEGPVVAIGMAEFEQGRDLKVTQVFERADGLMYENKKKLKE